MTTNEAVQGPLAGIRVLDFTRFQAGPAGSMHLSDLGAEVIKVENTRAGDLGRYYPTPNCPASSYFQALNRNKRSLSIDYHQPEGREVILRIVRTCDVVMENFRPGVVEHLHLAYEDLKRENPAIIYAHVTGFGRTGPYAHRPCFDLVAQAMSGLMSVTGEQEGSAVPVGAAIADQATALYGVMGILAAYIHRLRTGEGQEMEVSMIDSAIAIQTWEVTTSLMSGVVPPRVGPGRNMEGDVWRRFDTADGALVISGVFNLTSAGETRWDALCRVVGLGDLINNPDYDSPITRAGREHDFMPRLEEAFRRRTTAEWLAALDDADVIAGPVLDYEQAVSHPQVLHNGLLQEFDHPTAGKMRSVGTPLRFSKTGASIRSRAPELGEHTEEILGSAGYSSEEISKLREKKVIPD
jgi:crotonobetainyl-CoA:carnitine CoA-transferase CaiB-like acyl-CoA transferase